MKTLHAIILAVFFSTCFQQVAFTQETDAYGYNMQSLRPIHHDDQFFRKSLWLRLDLKEKQNKALMAKNNEITKVIIEAVKAGILRPFNNDSLATRMSQEQFLQNITIPNSSIDDEDILMGMTEEGEDPWNPEENTNTTSAAAMEYFPKDFTILELKEDLIFDKKRAKMYHDIQAISIYLPAEKNPTGIEKLVASFSYKELVENVFRDNPDAVWFNNQNPKEHRNLEEAFELRLFAGHLTKFANSEDNMVEDIYGSGKSALVMSQQLEHGLVEYESELWEN